MTTFRGELSHSADVDLPVIEDNCTTFRPGKAPTLKIDVLDAKVGQQRD